jgi:hypothetical protein
MQMLAVGLGQIPAQAAMQGQIFGGEIDASIGGELGPGACREPDAFI